MKIKNLIQISLLCAATLQTGMASFAAHAATITWTNTIGGSWSTAANWNPNTVPGTTDTAIISLGGVTVSLNSDTTVGEIILGANGSGTVTLNWTGNGIHLAGNLTVASNSVFNITGGGLVMFRGCVLTNYGTVNWTNTEIHGVDGYNQQIYNYGLWNAQSDNLFAGAFNGGSALFANFGTFRKSGTTGVTTLDAGVGFSNTGIVRVDSGTLALSGGTSSNGSFVTASGGSINFYGCHFTNSTTFTGLGSFLTGDAIFGGTVVGMLNWSGNNSHLAGNLTVASNSVFNILGGGLVMFRGCVLTNYGTVNWTNTEIHGVDSVNEQIYNYGLWNAQSDNLFAGAFNGGPALFANFGTFHKSGTTGTTILDAGVGFSNTGIVRVESGTLATIGGTSSGGSFVTAGGGNINFSACFFTNSTTFTGTGSFLKGDTVFGGMMVGTLNWSGNNSHLAGNLTVASNSVFNILGGGLVMFRGCVLTNYGTVNWSNVEIHGVDQLNEQIYNYGLWNAQSDNLFAGTFNGGSALFANFGTFHKSGTTGTTILDAGVGFNNTGTLDAQSGNIALQGAITLANGTQMSFGLGGPAGNGSITLSGPASFAGSLNVNLNSFYWPAVGSSFNLLNYGSESGLLFTNMTLPATGYLAWQTNYNPTAFTLVLAARTATNTVATNLNLSTLNSTNLVLQWPGDHTGWNIQAQTNPMTVGLSTNWATLADASQTNQLVMPINQTNGAVFFRMVYP
jgi:hypothetical protein